MTKKKHRTPDEIIADLELKIADVRARDAAKRAMAAPEGKPLVAAVKALDKAMAVAGTAKNEAMVVALESAMAPLSKLAVEMKIRLPKRATA